MESCPIPIEICELIIDFVGEGPPQDPERRHNLQQCALTCRAWRTRAQRCLWQVWHIRSSASINLFVDTIRRAPDSLVSYIHTLVLDFYDIRNIGPSGAISYPLPRLNELLLTTKLANLGELTLQGAVGPGSPLQLLHPNILRIRPPMLANVTVLELWRCTFSSPRSMLDLIWACPNLASLDIDDEWTFLDGTLVTEEAARRLVATCQRSGACCKLEDLDFSFNLSSDSSPSPLCHALFNVTHGSIFGSQITSMVLDVTMKQLRECERSFDPNRR
ncbi:hypothetical protein BC628DRAFT_1405084 [Trametes gibbosa]|nr:hypothetical protein BC628DRAFT_1405084 [Trametes gibbosa]